MSPIETLLTDYLNYLEIEKNRSVRTRVLYERYLQEFLRFAKIAKPTEITDSLVRNFRLALARSGRSKSTQGYYVIALRNFLRYLVRRDLPVLSPEKVELPKIVRPQIEVLAYGDLERLLAVPAKTDLRSARDRAILELFFSTGLRLAELCALDRYLDLGRGEFTVRGKGGKLRVVFLSARARQALTDYLKRRSDADPALFVSLSRQGKILGRITPRAVERTVEARARAAGIPGRVHPHMLRHGFATDLLINGADLRAVQELLGHANVSTTQIYTHLTNRELREIHQAFHGRRRKKGSE